MPFAGRPDFRKDRVGLEAFEQAARFAQGCAEVGLVGEAQAQRRRAQALFHFVKRPAAHRLVHQLADDPRRNAPARAAHDDTPHAVARAGFWSSRLK